MPENFQTGRRISVENVEKKNFPTLVYLHLITVFIFLLYACFTLDYTLIFIVYYTNVIKVKYTCLIYSCF
jgi:hypothetical protein